MKILKFYADWCCQCKVLEELLQKHNIVYDNINVDSEEGEKLSDTYKIKSLPTIIVLNDENSEVYRSIGLQPDIEYLKSIIKK